MKKKIRKRYMKDLKQHLVYIGGKEKKSLKILNYEIEQYMDEGTTYEELIKRFGEPQILADSFIEEYDNITLRKKIKKKRVLVVICVMSIFALGILFVLCLLDYYTAQNSYITREKEIINEN